MPSGHTFRYRCSNLSITVTQTYIQTIMMYVCILPFLTYCKRVTIYIYIHTHTCALLLTCCSTRREHNDHNHDHGHEKCQRQNTSNLLGKHHCVWDESVRGEMHLFLSVGSCSLLSSPWVIYIIIHIRVTPYYI